MKQGILKWAYIVQAPQDESIGGGTGPCIDLATALVAVPSASASIIDGVPGSFGFSSQNWTTEKGRIVFTGPETTPVQAYDGGEIDWWAQDGMKPYEAIPGYHDFDNIPDPPEFETYWWLDPDDVAASEGHDLRYVLINELAVPLLSLQAGTIIDLLDVIKITLGDSTLEGDWTVDGDLAAKNVEVGGAFIPPNTQVQTLAADSSAQISTGFTGIAITETGSVFAKVDDLNTMRAEMKKTMDSLVNLRAALTGAGTNGTVHIFDIAV